MSVQGHCLRDHKQQQLKGAGREEKMVQAPLSDQIPESNIIKDSDGGLRYFPSQGRILTGMKRMRKVTRRGGEDEEVDFHGYYHALSRELPLGSNQGWDRDLL